MGNFLFWQLYTQILLLSRIYLRTGQKSNIKIEKTKGTRRDPEEISVVQFTGKDKNKIPVSDRRSEIAGLREALDEPTKEESGSVAEGAKGRT